MSQYDPLYKWLSDANHKSVNTTFEQLEKLLGFPLPVTAKTRPQWWSNEQSNKTRHVQCKAWIDAGFRAHPDLNKQVVIFTKEV